MTGLLWVGALGSWLFVVAFVVDGATRPGFAPVRHPVSALALGPRGWIQTTNFVVCGLAIIAGAFVLAGALSSVLLALAVGVFGAALTASGLFPMDPMRGYPPGTPDSTPAITSRRHYLHDQAGTVVFLSLPITAVIGAFTVPGLWWASYSAITAMLLFVGFGAFGSAWENNHPRAGLVQRATLGVGLLWLGLLFAGAAS
ncbi:hypothetical protein AD006_30520 (plasmid) [Pseudonocardia sp. EC080610-09]|uniref:DUF998 domain-containing protein n=1 Tax=unclassified Pseudonocardia TaxID=2619320 RepID=UPI0007059693|nr:MULTISPECIES: DUF998 domain-containing protein [unclassified Pseudonocardia]ALL79546.1 hypothetical protein AD006_30520 [Pseudonocardia sp. EC080610-09]ALL85501.1 hypothetical protein AD017_30730 [Pseudonocardia sp. EC080619-01]